MSEAGAAGGMAELLVNHRPLLLSWVQREAGAPLLRFESAEDLVQSIQQEALRSIQRFQWQGQEAFLGWLHQVARRHLAGRRDHWFALKRNGAAILRLTRSGGESRAGAAPGVADTATGPATFASRREQLTLAARALALLPPRDRNLVQWAAAGASLEVQAARLGLSTDATQRARSRAIERLQKAYRLVSRGPARH
jgi:RNA polymerase sigma factor (sigma-70 family)